VTDWKDTYRRFLEHHGSKEKEISDSIEEACKEVVLLPYRVQIAVLKELNSWHRDKFITFEGFLKALEIMNENLKWRR